MNNLKCYACYNKNEEIRLKSSSGGIFYLLAKYAICNNGVIFGAIFDKNYNVIHDYVENIDDIKFLLGSKYVQSKINDSYKKVKYFLEQNRLVIFSGTPCQIAGLKGFLNKDYKNLITVDFICHGVPSPMIWSKYIKKIKGNKKIKRISFRDKTEGWEYFSLKIEFEDNTYYRNNLNKDIFIKGFLKNIYLRPSCYKCKFKTLNKDSDITLADCWGINNLIPKINDNKGISTILINSNKGNILFKLINNQIIYKSLKIDDVIKYNSSLLNSVNRPKVREKFFTLISNGKDIEKSIKKFTKDNLIRKIFNKVKKLVVIRLKKLFKYILNY